MNQPYDFSQQSFPRWLRLSDRHLKAANLLLDSAPEHAAFCYQQAAERYLKAYLVKRGAVFDNHTTDLRSLAKLCRSLDADFELVCRIAELDEMSTWQSAFQYPAQPASSEVQVPGQTKLFCARRVCKMLRSVVTAKDSEHGMDI
jgi:HEPN domain-containing protein